MQKTHKSIEDLSPNTDILILIILFLNQNQSIQIFKYK